MRTNFSSSNAAFSDKAHLAAQTQIYPAVFNTSSENVSYESVTLSDDPTNKRNQILDGEMAVDRKVYVTVNSFPFPLSYTVQERFRKPKFKKFQDITITEYNTSSGLPSELYKLSGGLFVYGYYDETNDKIEQFVVFSSSALLLSIASGEIKIDRRGFNDRSNQRFIAFKFDTLRNHGLILYEAGSCINSTAQNAKPASQ